MPSWQWRYECSNHNCDNRVKDPRQYPPCQRCGHRIGARKSFLLPTRGERFYARLLRLISSTS